MRAKRHQSIDMKTSLAVNAKGLSCIFVMRVILSQAYVKTKRNADNNEDMFLLLHFTCNRSLTTAN